MASVRYDSANDVQQPPKMRVHAYRTPFSMKSDRGRSATLNAERSQPVFKRLFVRPSEARHTEREGGGERKTERETERRPPSFLQPYLRRTLSVASLHNTTPIDDVDMSCGLTKKSSSKTKSRHRLGCAMYNNRMYQPSPPNCGCGCCIFAATAVVDSCHPTTLAFRSAAFLRRPRTLPPTCPSWSSKYFSLYSLYFSCLSSAHHKTHTHAHVRRPLSRHKSKRKTPATKPIMYTI